MESVLSMVAFIIIVLALVGMVVCTCVPLDDAKGNLVRQYAIVLTYCFCGALISLDYAIYSVDALDRTVGVAGMLISMGIGGVICRELAAEIKN